MKNSEIVFFTVLSALLFIGSLFYYTTFYPGLSSVFLALVLTLQFGLLSFLVGYLTLLMKTPTIGKGVAIILACSVLFMTTRFLVIYYSLQYYLPSDTIYRTPNRTLPFLLITNLIIATAVLFYTLYRKVALENSLLKKHLSELTGKADTPYATLEFKVDGKQVSIDCNEVRFLNSEREYTKITTVSQTYLILDRLKNFEQRLPKPDFLRTHRSYIVNTARVNRLDERYVYMDEHQIPIGKSYQKHVAIVLEDQGM